MKTKMLLTIISCLAIITILIGCSTQKTIIQQEKPIIQISTIYPYYSSLDNLTEKADLIIEGTVLDSRVEEIDTRIKTINEEDEKLNPGGDETASSKDIYTVYAIKISDSYKGDVESGEIIEVKQLGGESETNVYIAEDSVNFVKNEKYIIFLATYENTPASLLNPIQSTYYVLTDNTVNKELISANAKNNLTLTIEDLKEIKDKFKK